MPNRFQYDTAMIENIPCNLCDADSFIVLARSLSDGMRVQTCLCRNCGLVYINPRMTRTEYDRYYKTYYHDERLRIKGRIKSKDITESGFEVQVKFGVALAEILRAYFHKGLVLDVGSSRGGVLYGIQKVCPDVRVVGIEPEKTDAAFANEHGIKTYNTLFENFDPDELGLLSAVVCVQTFNHLLDPRGFLVWSHDHLVMGGHIILAVKNFRQQCRRAGAVYSSVQIDHPYMFTPETLEAMVRSVGFEIVYVDIDEHKSSGAIKRQRARGLKSSHHMRVVARKVSEHVREVHADIGRGSASRMRLQIFAPYLRLYHFFVYSNWRKRLDRVFAR